MKKEINGSHWKKVVLVTYYLESPIFFQVQKSYNLNQILCHITYAYGNNFCKRNLVFQIGCSLLISKLINLVLLKLIQ